MFRLDSLAAHPLACLFGAIGLVTVIFLLDQKHKSKRREGDPEAKPWVSENPPLEVSRHG